MMLREIKAGTKFRNRLNGLIVIFERVVIDDDGEYAGFVVDGTNWYFQCHENEFRHAYDFA